MGILGSGLFASAAWAEGAAPQGGMLGMLMPLGLFVVIFYFLIIRPQKKKQKKHDAMLSSIRRGDQVVSAGGFFGQVKEVKDDSFIVEIADGVKVRILKGSVSMKRSEGEGAEEKGKKSEPKEIADDAAAGTEEEKA